MVFDAFVVQNSRIVYLVPLFSLTERYLCLCFIDLIASYCKLSFPALLCQLPMIVWTFCSDPYPCAFAGQLSRCDVIHFSLLNAGTSCLNTSANGAKCAIEEASSATDWTPLKQHFSPDIPLYAAPVSAVIQLSAPFCVYSAPDTSGIQHNCVQYPVVIRHHGSCVSKGIRACCEDHRQACFYKIPGLCDESS